MAKEALDRIAERHRFAADSARLAAHVEAQAETVTAAVLTAIEGCGLSRYEIAQRSGVTEATLSRFVNGLTSLTLQNLDKLAPVIGLRVTTEKRQSRRTRKR